jgi:Domain of unknown function (DUF4249)
VKLFVTIILLIGSWMIAGSGCKKSYAPPAIKVDKRYLVVEGVLVNSIDSPSVFVLSRTKRLTDSTTESSPETGARVSIQSNAGEEFVCTAQGAGIYQAGPLPLNISAAYRLKILTAGGVAYASAYVPVKQTPPIDTITWRQQNDVTIYADTHDAASNTKYYRWDFTETWQYHAALNRTIAQKNGTIFYVDSTNQTYNCWSIESSDQVLTASSAALTSDIISKAPLTIIPQNSEKIGVRYSILVKQYAITPDAYQYLEILKKNTEQLGSVFDAQPTQLTGNIFCISDPSQIAIGFVSASSVQQKRIFIANSEVSDWHPVNTGETCDTVKILQDPNNFLLYNYPDPAFMPYYFSSPNFIILTKGSCVDCSLRGGTTRTPSFW